MVDVLELQIKLRKMEEENYSLILRAEAAEQSRDSLMGDNANLVVCLKEKEEMCRRLQENLEKVTKRRDKWRGMHDELHVAFDFMSQRVQGLDVECEQLRDKLSYWETCR